jgi:hypothetical protein
VAEYAPVGRRTVAACAPGGRMEDLSVALAYDAACRLLQHGPGRLDLLTRMHHSGEP